MSNAVKVIIAFALVVIVGAVGFIGGFAVAQFAPQSIPGSTEDSTVGRRVEEVEALLRADALKPPSETSATAGAIQGLLESSGDNYGTYFDPRRFQFFNEESMGQFGGIGVVLGEKDGTTYVVEVYKNTPAAKAGMKAGDLFVGIDGVRRDKWTSEEVVKRVRGEAGTKVKLTMLRPNEKAEKAGHPGGPVGKEYTSNVTRATIELPNVEGELKGKVGYISVGQFNQKTADDIKQQIAALEKKGAKSFVLDLRNNPGGLLSQAVEVTSLFVDSGVVVRVEERGKPAIEERTTGNQVTKAPLVLLINENSASASEIVGGALQDYSRATLIGQKSFGKGSVQTIKELSFGGAVKFTTAHYLTPKGRVIDGKGLTPDVVVKMDVEKQLDEKTDTQLKKALELAEKKAR